MHDLVRNPCLVLEAVAPEQTPVSGEQAMSSEGRPGGGAWTRLTEKREPVGCLSLKSGTPHCEPLHAEELRFPQVLHPGTHSQVAGAACPPTWPGPHPGPRYRPGRTPGCGGSWELEQGRHRGHPCQAEVVWGWGSETLGCEVRGGLVGGHAQRPPEVIGYESRDREERPPCSQDSGGGEQSPAPANPQQLNGRRELGPFVELRRYLI